MTWLADVKGRCEAATAGPWECVACENETASEGWNEIAAKMGMPPVPRFRVEAELYARAEDGTKRNILPMGGTIMPLAFKDNGDFIAHARQDLPRCIAWIERAKGAMDDVRDHFDDFHDWEPESKLGRLYDRLGQILSELEQA